MTIYYDNYDCDNYDNDILYILIYYDNYVFFEIEI